MTPHTPFPRTPEELATTIDDPLVEWWNQKFHAAHGYASRKEMFRDIERQTETLEEEVDNPCVNGKVKK